MSLEFHLRFEWYDFGRFVSTVYSKPNFTSMKKPSFIILCFLLIGFGTHTVNAQDLLGDLHGSWNMTKYQSRVKTQLATGKVTFESDGGFVSEGVYFGTEKGLFSTDETRSVVIIDIDGVKSEWTASVKKGVLRLRTPSGTKQPKVYMMFQKIKV